MLAGLHLLPDQISMVSCSTFVSVVFHIAKAVSNEAHPGLRGDGRPRDRGVLGVAEPTAAILLLQLAFRDHKVVLLYLCQIIQRPTFVPRAVSQSSATKDKLSQAALLVVACLLIPEEIPGENSISRDVLPCVRKG